MKPLIGITMNLEEQATRDLNILDLDYGRAVLQAGGIPAPVLGIETSISDLIKRFDGFVFTGGDDIHPRFYKERPLPDARMTLSPDARTRFEIKLFKAAIKARKPILAICHGMQLVNVALGGSLYQDIPLQIPKSLKHGAAKRGEKVFHPIALFDGTMLQRIMNAGSIPRVRSGHHQGVKNLGWGLQLGAATRDGVIEALEWRGSQFVVAVQWHPEKTPHDRCTKKLFKALIDASKQ
jgi:putative glutamine amidotransferase